MLNLKDDSTSAMIPILAGKRVWSEDEMGIEIPAGLAYADDVFVNIVGNTLGTKLRTAEVINYSTENNNLYNSVVWWCSRSYDGWAVKLSKDIPIRSKQYIALRLGEGRARLLSTLLASSDKIAGDIGGYTAGGLLRVFRRNRDDFNFHAGICVLRLHTRDLTVAELELNKLIDTTRYGLTS